MSWDVGAWVIDTLNTAINNFKTSTESGNVPIIRHVQWGTFTIDSDTTEVTITLSGFSNLSKMMVLINGSRTCENSTASTQPGRYVTSVRSAYLSSLATDSFRIKCLLSGAYPDRAVGSYQVVEFY